MGLTSTLYSGISGLQTNAEAMSVTGNNISNSNTIGYKSSSTVFSDMLSATISTTGTSVNQVGRGSELTTVRSNFSQGSFQSTSSDTDLAVEGAGFFMLSAAGTDEVVYTRNGAFHFDPGGYLVNADGYRVQGQLFDADGTPGGGDPVDIKVDLTSQVPALQTSNIVLTTNLNSGTEEIPGGFDLSDPSESSNYSTSTPIYDALGETHLATTYFTKTGDQTWEWNTVVDSADLDPSVASSEESTVIGTGTLTFDDDGQLIGTSGFDLDETTLMWASGADPTQSIAIEFDTTQFGRTSTVYSQDQDGYAAGEVVETSINSEGVVSVSYSNGETRDIATLTLATFTNPGGLVKEGNSLYSASRYSGNPQIGTPGASQGIIYTNSLELSNVDLSQEFVDMITIQNGYSANSKVITTTDEMLQEVINLIR